jgi:hypothetical protein
MIARESDAAKVSSSQFPLKACPGGLRSHLVSTVACQESALIAKGIWLSFDQMDKSAGQLHA